LEPFYAEAAALDLAVIPAHLHGSCRLTAPGGLDTGTICGCSVGGAPLCGMRNMASLIGSGVMDRYPTVRIGTLEGHGWLPFWIARLDEHAETIKAALPTAGAAPE